MATAAEYAQWITKNADKRGSSQFETVAKAYQAKRKEEETQGLQGMQRPPVQPSAQQPDSRNPTITGNEGDVFTEGGAQAAATGKMDPGTSSVVRPLAKGIFGAISFIPDIATDIGNAIPGLGPLVERPSDHWNSIVDKYTSAPSAGMGKFAEGFNEILASGGVAGLDRKLLGIAEKEGGRVYSKITSQAAQDAHTAGYKLSPAYIGGKLAKDIQTMAGGPKVHMTNSSFNEEVSDRLAKAELGLTPETDLDEITFKRLKQEAYEPYAVFDTIGDVTTSRNYRDKIDAAGGRFANRGKSFGGSRFESIEKEKANYKTMWFNAGEAKDEVRELRRLSRMNLRNYNPEANALGQTQREISDAIDEELQRVAHLTLKDPHAIDRLRAARVALSKISFVEDSMGPGGHVRASDYALGIERKMPLSGGLKTIGMTARNFKKDVQSVSTTGETGEFSAIDYLLGGSGMVSGHPKITGLILARPVSRWALGTETVQRKMLKNMRGGKRSTARELARGIGSGAAIMGYEDFGAPDDGED